MIIKFLDECKLSFAFGSHNQNSLDTKDSRLDRIVMRIICSKQVCVLFS